jgi:hypothetical protein
VGEFEGIGRMGSSHVAEDLRGFHFKDHGSGCWPVDSGGGFYSPTCIHKPPVLVMSRDNVERRRLGENTPWSGEDLVQGERWGKVGTKAAWFLERIRELNFMGTEDHRAFCSYGARRDGGEGNTWWWDTQQHCTDHRGNCLISKGSLEGITWSVLIEYLSFIREKSNWTTSIAREPDSASRDCVSHYERLMNGEVSGMGEGHVYECFNQEQDEELPAAWAAAPNASSQIADFPRREHVEHDVGFGDIGGARWGRRRNKEETKKETKKEMIHEILGILEEKAEKSELEEGAYKAYGDLLMEFYKSAGDVK